MFPFFCGIWGEFVEVKGVGGRGRKESGGENMVSIPYGNVICKKGHSGAGGILKRTAAERRFKRRKGAL